MTFLFLTESNSIRLALDQTDHTINIYFLSDKSKPDSFKRVQLELQDMEILQDEVNGLVKALRQTIKEDIELAEIIDKL